MARRELCHPKGYRKVSGLSKNGPWSTGLSSPQTDRVSSSVLHNPWRTEMVWPETALSSAVLVFADWSIGPISRDKWYAPKDSEKSPISVRGHEQTRAQRENCRSETAREKFEEHALRRVPWEFLPHVWCLLPNRQNYILLSWQKQGW